MESTIKNILPISKLKNIILVFLFWLPLCLCAQEKPNIILIYTDDQSVHSERELEFVMPNVARRLKAGGVTFENYICSEPYCAPSRASLLTGQFSHTNQHKNNTDSYDTYKVKYFEKDLPCSIKSADYFTIFVGKYFNPGNIRPKPNCWDLFTTFLGANYTNTHVLRYLENMLLVTGKPLDDIEFRTNKELEYIQEDLENYVNNNNKLNPFFLYYAPYAPHETNNFNIRGDASSNINKTYASNYNSFANTKKVPRIPSFYEEDIKDKVYYGKSKVDTNLMDILYKERFKSLKNLDDKLEEHLFTQLEKYNLYHNTIIIFTSDNGYLLGEHKKMYKRHPYEESINVPFYVKNINNKNAGMVLNNLIGTVDIAPTLIALSGGKTFLNSDGLDFSDCFKIGKCPERKGIYCELIQHEQDGKPNWYAYRTLSEIIIEYENIGYEYYNLDDDPYQLNNSFDAAKHKVLIELLDKNKGE